MRGEKGREGGGEGRGGEGRGKRDDGAKVLQHYGCVVYYGTCSKMAFVVTGTCFCKTLKCWLQVSTICYIVRVPHKIYPQCKAKAVS